MFARRQNRNNDRSVRFLRPRDGRSPIAGDSGGGGSFVARALLPIATVALISLGPGSSPSAAAPEPPPPVLEPTAEQLVPQFWQRLAMCETTGRWDWGRYANTPQQRRLEGTRFEGGLGFAASTWQAWARAVRVLDDYPHAWMAPPLVQVRVAAYGLRHGGSWGCLRRDY